MIEFKFSDNEFTLGRNVPDYDKKWNVIINERYNSYFLCYGEKVVLDNIKHLDQVVSFFEKPENLEKSSSPDSNNADVDSGENSSSSKSDKFSRHFFGY